MLSSFTMKSLKLISNVNLSENCAIGSDNMSYIYFNHNKTKLLKYINRNGTNYRFTAYKELLLLKGRDKLPRCISIPTIRDRICLYAILKELKSAYTCTDNKYIDIIKPRLPQQVISCLTNKIDTEKSNYNYFMKFDINHFFDTIQHDRLLSLLNGASNMPTLDKNLISLIKNAISTPTCPRTAPEKEGIPQGIPIASILSNIYMFNLSSKMRSMLPSNIDFLIIRYVDDVIILCEDNSSTIIENSFLKLIQNEYKLSINKNKVAEGSILSNSFDFLGYTFAGNNKKTIITVRQQSVAKLKMRLISTMMHYKKNAKKNINIKNKTTSKVVSKKRGVNIHALTFDLNLLISGSIATDPFKNPQGPKRYGWLFYFSQITDTTLLYSLDAFTKKN